MDDASEQVILVDRDDREIGLAAKLPAHELGYLHRAVSVCVLDDDKRMLLQKRAAGKYHSGGLWTNACCTHPRQGETPLAAAGRRLREELGVDCPLNFVLRAHYRAEVGNALVENEVVHLFAGRYAGHVRRDPKEVEDFAWSTREALLAAIAERPQDYTYWFRYYLKTFDQEIFG